MGVSTGPTSVTVDTAIRAMPPRTRLARPPSGASDRRRSLRFASVRVFRTIGSPTERFEIGGDARWTNRSSDLIKEPGLRVFVTLRIFRIRIVASDSQLSFSPSSFSKTFLRCSGSGYYSSVSHRTMRPDLFGSLRTFGGFQTRYDIREGGSFPTLSLV